MPGERASIKGGEVVSVKVGPVWTIIKIAVPTVGLQRASEKKNVKGPFKRTRAAAGN